MEQKKLPARNLIIVDCQNDFCQPDGSLYVKGADEVCAKIARMLLTTKFDNVFVAMDCHPENHSSFKQNGGQWPVHCVEGTHGYELHPLIQKALDLCKYNTVIVKKGTDPATEQYGAFEKELPEEIYGGINFVVGVAGDYCVRHTVSNILKYGVPQISMIPECIASIDPVAFADALKEFGTAVDYDYVLKDSAELYNTKISVFDNDLYKFTTSYAYMVKYPHAVGTFSFTDRNKTKFTKEMLGDLKRFMLSQFTRCHYNTVPMKWLEENIPYIPRYYWEWLTNSFRYDAGKVNIYLDEDSHLHIDVTDNLYKSSLYEIQCLCMVSQFLGQQFDGYTDSYMLNRTFEKVAMIQENPFKFSEFGTRRRYNYTVQETVVSILAKSLPGDVFVGTSNVELAYKYGLKPMGTHPHEWFMFHGAQFGIKHANYMALQAWQEVYHGDLGIALTDTYTSDLFFENFTKEHAMLFMGIRQDSGDELEFTEKAVARYKEHNINPLAKTIIFSNGLDIPKAISINEYCKGKVLASFGIGTEWTNDVGMPKRPNIVMKLINCKMSAKAKEMPCIKISDDKGKYMGDPDEIQAALRIIEQTTR